MQHPRPTVEDQVREARAPAGSPLEKLIQANQDFDLLAPEELGDDYSIPLWLRVFYRKQHPEIEFPRKNPGAAYPEILSQYYSRMVAQPYEHWGGYEGEPQAPPKRRRSS